MKLFSRDNKIDEHDDDFDPDDLPTKDDFSPEFFDEEDEIQAPHVRSKPRAIATYGIENVIDLMRELPKDSGELVVTVVNKTLSSLDIEVSDIIRDAEDKEQNIRENQKALEDEVKSLQARIAERNTEIAELTRSLKETSEVKRRLKLALDVEQKMKAAEQPKTKAAEVKTPETSPQVPAPQVSSQSAEADKAKVVAGTVASE